MDHPLRTGVIVTSALTLLAPAALLAGLRDDAPAQPAEASAPAQTTPADSPPAQPAPGNAAEPTPGPQQADRVPVPELGYRFSGFLGDYSGLVPSPTQSDALYEQRPELKNYTRFIVEPVTVLMDRTPSGGALSPHDARALGEQMRSAVVESLTLAGHAIVTEPGPGVASIRGCITEVVRSRHEPGTEPVMGGADTEMEIVDSLTRARLGAAVEADRVSPGEPGDEVAGDEFADARLVFGHWSARLALWLNRVRDEN